MSRTQLTSISLQVYRLLLRLYPSTYRDAYADLMLQAFGDQCRDADRQGRGAWLGLWRRTFDDVARTLFIEHLAARKANAVQPAAFNHQPDRQASLLFLLPGLLLSLFYLFTIYNGESAGYMGLALVGVVGFALGSLKRLRRLRIWQHFALGYALAAGLLLCLSPMLNWWLPALNTLSWQMLRALVALVVCTALILRLARLLRSRWLIAAVAGIVLGGGGLALFLPRAAPGSTALLWYMNWTLAYSAAIFAIVLLGHWLSRRTGLRALLAVIVALATLNAITLNIADVAQGKTFYGQVALLLAYLVPLVICPAWLLMAHTWPGKKYGVLLSWAAMLLNIGLLLPLLDVFLEPHFFRAARPLENLLFGLGFGLLPNLPLFIGLWSAFAIYEKRSPQADLTAMDSPELLET